MKMSKNLPSLTLAKDLNIEFPENSKDLTEAENAKIKNAIINGGALNSDGNTFIKKKKIGTLLACDNGGANRVYNNLSDKDKLIFDNERYASVSSILHAVSDRVQEPRDAIIREKLRQSEKGLIALRDSPTAEKTREIMKSRIEIALPNLKKDKIERDSLVNCQLSGEALEKDAHAHHVNRKSDNPRNALNLDDILVVNPDIHDEIHKNKANTREELEELIKEKGWNNPYSSPSDKGN
ncbi:TPA: hypothetical protein MIU36_23505 [Klebsiella pneumoniae]|nr:hypothetical protein [Klebsiella pneumoniae]